jgi:hypothetical protein
MAVVIESNSNNSKIIISKSAKGPVTLSEPPP